MKATDYREIDLETGTKIGLFGDYSAAPLWGESILVAKILDWVLIQRQDSWDTAVLAELPKADSFIDAEGNVSGGNQILLVHRYPDGKWDGFDPTVHVYALSSEALAANNISISQKEIWDYLVWLSSAAIMTIQNEDNLSKVAKSLRSYLIIEFVILKKDNGQQECSPYNQRIGL